PDGKPAVTILAPANASQVPVNQAVTIQVNGTDAQGVTRVEIKVDGVLVVAAQSQVAQGQPSLDAVQFWTFGQAGSHVVTGQAYNAAGQVSDLAAVTVQVVQETANLVPVAAATDEPTATVTATLAPTEAPIQAPTEEPTTEPTTAPEAPTTAPKPPTTVPKPVIASFTADPPTINSGASTTLHWQVTGADSVAIDQGVGTVNASGSKQV